jgi:hypothetical protein
MTAFYALTHSPTPVFNTTELSHCFGGANGDTLLLDDQHLMRTVETVLFPETPVHLLTRVAQTSLWKIATDAYPYPGNLYIHEQFVHTASTPFDQKKIDPLTANHILQKMCELERTRYIWGGNWPPGIDFLPKLYPSKTPLSRLNLLIQETWQLKGVDCSGLLYYATQGYTPRNTSSLIHFGNPVDIEGKNVQDLARELQALDIIVWAGHVICVLDKKTTIESIVHKGVIKTNILDRLSEITKERKPANRWGSTPSPHFVVRRWYT